MNNGLNNTGSTPGTQNPQGITGIPETTKTDGFQSTADQDVLNKKTDSLSVQSTGEPVANPTESTSDTSSLPVGWLVLIVVSIVLIVVVVVKIIRDIIEEDRQTNDKEITRPTKTSTATVASSPKAKKPKKSVSRSGKKKSAKKSKKRSSKK